MEKYVIWWFKQWYVDERNYWSRLHNSGLDGQWLREFSAYFGIARNFNSKSWTEKLKGPAKDAARDEFFTKAVVGCVKDVCKKPGSTGRNRVVELAKKLDQETYRNRPIATGNIVVAASKICWMYDRDNVRIIDGRAESALATDIAGIKRARKIAGQPYRKEDHRYEVFVEAWNHQYALQAGNIATACESFAKSIRKLPASFDVDPADLGQEWFRKRVFDLYLWDNS